MPERTVKSVSLKVGVEPTLSVDDDRHNLGADLDKLFRAGEGLQVSESDDGDFHKVVQQVSDATKDISRNDGNQGDQLDPKTAFLKSVAETGTFDLRDQARKEHNFEPI